MSILHIKTIKPLKFIFYNRLVNKCDDENISKGKQTPHFRFDEESGLYDVILNYEPAMGGVIMRLLDQYDTAPLGNYTI